MMNALLNGKPSDTIKVDDRGLAYGDGLFETVEFSQGKLLYWQRHIDRLILGCQRLSIPIPNCTQLLEEAMQLLSEQQEGVLKVIITRGGGGRGYRFPEPMTPTRLLTVHPKADFPNRYKTEGVSLALCKSRLGLNSQFAGLKHLNRLEQVMARSEMGASMSQEGLMLDYEGFPVEGTMSNLFWFSEGTLFTPELSLCGVAGVIRSVIIELAERNKIPCQQGRFTMAQLWAADELFLTNSLIGIWPVKQLAEQPFLVGNMTRRLMDLLAEEREKEMGCLK
jgi:4-amino-4-deoxychorismate lyase